jgi:hypothetical protein
MNLKNNDKMSNEEMPTIANPLLCEVAVLSCSRKRFDLWVRENAQWGEKYICVMSIRDVLGRQFKRVEKSFEWFRIEEASVVEEATMLRCR